LLIFRFFILKFVVIKWLNDGDVAAVGATDEFAGGGGQLFAAVWATKHDHFHDFGGCIGRDIGRGAGGRGSELAPPKHARRRRGIKAGVSRRYDFEHHLMLFVVEVVEEKGNRHNDVTGGGYKRRHDVNHVERFLRLLGDVGV